MLPIHKILFPVDFSERCSAAAWHVAAMARHFNAELTLLHVVHIPPMWYGDLAAAELEMTVDVPQILENRRKALDCYLQHELETAEHVERIVQQGDPAQLITEYARNEDVGLIMMPTHGHGPFRRFLLGSITSKVLHDADCPVWTDVHEGAFPRTSCKSVVCAVDFRDEAVASMQWAAAFAASHGADLTFMHAIPALEGPTPPGEVKFRSYLAEHTRKYISSLQQKAGTPGRICIEGGKIAETVRNAALQHAADLVVVGQGRIHKTLGRLRSNAYAIVREAPCPVVRV